MLFIIRIIVIILVWTNKRKRRVFRVINRSHRFFR